MAKLATPKDDDHPLQPSANDGGATDATDGTSAATDAPAEAAGKAARGEESPAWQRPDYCGPLTGEQALWRNQHLRRK